MKTTAHRKFSQGFTLIELLVVIGILATLLAITLIAINPARQFAAANDTKRRSDILQILNAIHQYAAENGGQLPAGVKNLPDANAHALSSDTAGGAADICADIMPKYISALPEDPQINKGNPITDCASYDTGYEVTKDASGRVTVSAPLKEGDDPNPIQVIR